MLLLFIEFFANKNKTEIEQTELKLGSQNRISLTEQNGI